LQQQQGNPHELDKQLVSQQGLAGPRPSIAQQQTMYQNQATSMGRAQPVSITLKMLLLSRLSRNSCLDHAFTSRDLDQL